MPKLKIKNISTVTLKSLRPGQVMVIDVDADGIPFDPFWQQRFEEERLFKAGALEVVSPTPVAAPTPPAPKPAAPAPVAAASPTPPAEPTPSPAPPNPVAAA